MNYSTLDVIRKKNYDIKRIIDAYNTTKESCVVVKPTRAGYTTSAVMGCVAAGEKVLIVTPTKKIGTSTVKNADNNSVAIPGNKECIRLKMMISKDPFLEQLPLGLPKCDGCSNYDNCEVVAFLDRNEEGITSAYITYAKLNFIMTSDSKRAEELKTKLRIFDVVIFDEAHTLAFPSVPSVERSPIDENQFADYPHLVKLRRRTPQ